MPSAQELLKTVESLNAESKSEEVIDLLPDELLATYNNVDLYLEKAVAYDRLNMGALTILTIEKALILKPENARGFLLKANGYYDLRQYEKAIENYKKAIEINPKYKFPYNGLGNAYNDIKQYDKAIESYNKAIELDPKYIFSYYGSGIVYRQLYEHDKAIASYNKAIELDPKYTSPYNGLGNVYYDLKQFINAVQHYSKAIELDPKYALPYYNRAMAHFENGEYKQALTDYQRYVQLTKENPDYFTSQSKSRILEIEKLLDIPGYNRISELVDLIKDLLRFNDNCVTHYTGMSAAKAMILEDSPLRLSEGAYLNDTSEGRELFKYLSLQISPIKGNDTIAEPFAKKPFIGSFVPENKHDDLTLWRMYGKEAKEEAKGCAVTLRKENLLESLKAKLNTSKDNNDTTLQIDGDLSFYRVAYRTHDEKKHFCIPSAESDEIALNNYMQELAKKVRKYTKKQTSTSDTQNLLERINEIAYLFKSAEYQYEHEIRLVIKGIGFEKKIDPKSIPPKVYIELLPINPVIKSITLGPKVERSDEWASAFYYTLDRKELRPKILISHLPFK